MSEMKAIADENRRLRKMYAEMAMQNELLKASLDEPSPSERERAVISSSQRGA